MKLLYIIFFVCVLNGYSLFAQQGKTGLIPPPLSDTTKKDSARGRVLASPVKDTAALLWHKHIPKYATRRSAILPGWGQAYNHEYWKIPIVYGVLAIPTITFLYNNQYYKLTKFAYEAVYAATIPIIKDSTMFNQIDARVKQSDGTALSLSSYQSYRNSFRRDRDYSVFWFLIVWGLNVVDATVFAHLKDFDVSENVTMHIQPSFNPVTKGPGLSLVFNFNNSSRNKIIAR
jgi:hypothetical protein